MDAKRLDTQLDPGVKEHTTCFNNSRYIHFLISIITHCESLLIK
jgi:hypothetical protein